MYKEMRTYLANVGWNNLLKNKTATECWTCLKYEIEGITKKFVPLGKQGKGPGRNTCQKRLLEKLLTNRCYVGGGYINTRHM